MNNLDYGDKFKDHLIEQYKLYVEMTDRVSQRRLQTNHFYISVSSGLLVIVTFFIEKDFLRNYINTVYISIALLGILLNIIWYLNIKSYRQLNSSKFKVIHNLESLLPYNCFDEEWKLLKDGKSLSKYFRLTKIEQFVPLLLLLPYFILFIFGIFSI